MKATGNLSLGAVAGVRKKRTRKEMVKLEDLTVQIDGSKVFDFEPTSKLVTEEQPRKRPMSFYS